MTRVLTIRQFARSLRLGESTVKHWAQEGVISCYRLGRRVLIPLAERERLLRDNEWIGPMRRRAGHEG